MSLPRLENEDNIHIELLIQYGNNNALTVVQKKFATQSPYIFAPEGGDIQIYYVMHGKLEQLEESFKTKLPKPNTHSYLLFVAVTHGRTRIVNLLNGNYKIPFSSPTFQAAWEKNIGYFNVFKNMLSTPNGVQHVAPKLLEKDEFGNQPMGYAVASGEARLASVVFDILQTLDAKNIPHVFDELAYLPLVALSSRQLQCLPIFMDTIASKIADSRLVFPRSVEDFDHYIYTLMDNAIRFNTDPSNAILLLLDSITNESYRKVWATYFMEVTLEHDFLYIYTAIAKKYDVDEQSIKEKFALKEKNNPFYYQLLDLSDKKMLKQNAGSLLDQYMPYLRAKKRSASDYYLGSQLAFLTKRFKLARELYDKFTSMRPTKDWFEAAIEAATRKCFALFDKTNIEVDPAFFELYTEHFLDLTNVNSSYFHIAFDALLFRTKNATISSDNLAELQTELNAIKMPKIKAPNNEEKNVRNYKSAVLTFSVLQIMSLVDSLFSRDITTDNCSKKNNSSNKKNPTAEGIKEAESLIILYSISSNIMSFSQIYLGLLPGKNLLPVASSYNKEINELNIAISHAKAMIKKDKSTNDQHSSSSNNTASTKNEDLKKDKRRKIAEENANKKLIIKQEMQKLSNAAKMAKKEALKSPPQKEHPSEEQHTTKDEKAEKEIEIKSTVAEKPQEKAEKEIKPKKLTSKQKEILARREEKKASREKSTIETGIPSIATNSLATTESTSHSTVEAFAFAKDAYKYKNIPENTSTAAQLAEQEKHRQEELKKLEEEKIKKEEEKRAANKIKEEEKSISVEEKPHSKVGKSNKAKKKARKKEEVTEKTEAQSTTKEASTASADEETGIPSIATNTVTTTASHSTATAVTNTFAKNTPNKKMGSSTSATAAANFAESVLNLNQKTKPQNVFKKAFTFLFHQKSKHHPRTPSTPANQSSTLPIIRQFKQLEAAPTVATPSHPPTLFVPVYIPVPVAVPVLDTTLFISRPVSIPGAIQSFGNLNGLPDTISNLLEKFEGRIAIADTSALSVKLKQTHLGPWKLILLAEDEDAWRFFPDGDKKNRNGLTHLLTKIESTEIDIQLLPPSLFNSLEDAMFASNQLGLLTLLGICLVINQLGYRFFMSKSTEKDIAEKMFNFTNPSLPLNFLLNYPHEYINVLQYKHQFQFNYSNALNNSIDYVKNNEDLFRAVCQTSENNLAVQRAFSELIHNLSYAAGHTIIEENNLRDTLLESGIFNNAELTFFRDELIRNSSQSISFKPT